MYMSKFSYFYFKYIPFELYKTQLAIYQYICHLNNDFIYSSKIKEIIIAISNKTQACNTILQTPVNPSIQYEKDVLGEGLVMRFSFVNFECKISSEIDIIIL